ncbi:unnamed protein product [Rhizophagus irregularis]|nr:unnamed protein product [Rhizophagus irregularis]
MPKQYSKDFKWRVVYLWNDGYSLEQISKVLYISRRTIYRILNYYILWKDVKNPIQKLKGQKKIFNNSDLKILIGIVKENPDVYLDEMVAEIARRTGKEVSITTVWRSLKYCGITRKKLEKHAKERSEILRSHYIMTVGSHFQPEQLIFLDESAKDERTPCRQYGYSPQNKRAIKKVVYIRGTRYTILPAMSLDGIIALDIMQGSCNKERFFNFILAKVVSLIS